MTQHEFTVGQIAKRACELHAAECGCERGVDDGWLNYAEANLRLCEKITRSSERGAETTD